jgi:hypothetical protein
VQITISSVTQELTSGTSIQQPHYQHSLTWKAESKGMRVFRLKFPITVFLVFSMRIPEQGANTHFGLTVLSSDALANGNVI